MSFFSENKNFSIAIIIKLIVFRSSIDGFHLIKLNILTNK
jgi:hypothetical protein